MDDLDDKDDTKRKSRNLSEKKRRDQFNILVTELGTMVSPANRKMDKTTVLRTTIAFLKQHNESNAMTQVKQGDEIQENWKPAFLTNEEFTHLMLEALEGFILVLGSDGAIQYSSENVTSLLGYLPKDLVNRCVYELIEECDKVQLYNLLLNPPMEEQEVNIYLHIKRGTAAKSIEKEAARCELVKLSGYFRKWSCEPAAGTHNGSTTGAGGVGSNFDGYCSDDDSLSVVSGYSRLSQPDAGSSAANTTAGGNGATEKIVFVATARLQTAHLLREIPLLQTSSKNEFTSRYSLEWKFLALDQRAPPIIGYLPFELLGTSGYEYYHMDDLDRLTKCHEALMETGEGTSSYYRFLSKGQQWIWLQTRYFITYHQWNSKPEFVVATHKVINYADVVNELTNGRKGELDEDEDESMDVKNHRAGSPSWSSRSSMCGSSSTTATRRSQDQRSAGYSSFVGGSLGQGGGNVTSDDYENGSQSGTAVQVKSVGAKVAVEPVHPPPQTFARLPELATAIPPPSAASVSSKAPLSVSRVSGGVPGGVKAVLEEEPDLPPMQMSPMAGTSARLAPVASSATVAEQPLLISSVSALPAEVTGAAPITARPTPVSFSPAQAQLQTQLRTKHAELARRIAGQQEELRAISEQLLMSQYGLVPVNVSYQQGVSSVAGPAAAAAVGGSNVAGSSSAATATTGTAQVGKHHIVYTSITSMPDLYQS